MVLVQEKERLQTNKKKIIQVFFCIISEESFALPQPFFDYLKRQLRVIIVGDGCSAFMLTTLTTVVCEPFPPPPAFPSIPPTSLFSLSCHLSHRLVLPHQNFPFFFDPPPTIFPIESLPEYFFFFHFSFLFILFLFPDLFGLW